MRKVAKRGASGGGDSAAFELKEIQWGRTPEQFTSHICGKTFCAYFRLNRGD